MKANLEIRRPLLAKGTKAAWLGLTAFLTISGHANQLSGYAFISLESSNRWLITTPRSTTQDPFHHQKPFHFQICFQGPKNQTKWPPRLPTNNKNRTRNSSKRFVWKSISIQESIQIWPGNTPEQKTKRHFKLFELQKLIYTDPKIKSNKIM